MVYLVKIFCCGELCYVIISPHKVFGDIIILTSPPLTVDPNNVDTLNSKNIQRISFKFYIWVYSRTPLLRPPLGLAICGRNRGVAVIQALEHVATSVCVAKHMYDIT